MKQKSSVVSVLIQNKNTDEKKIITNVKLFQRWQLGCVFNVIKHQEVERRSDKHPSVKSQPLFEGKCSFNFGVLLVNCGIKGLKNC